MGYVDFKEQVRKFQKNFYLSSIPQKTPISPQFLP